MPEKRHATLALSIAVAACKALFPGVSTRAQGLADLAGYAFSGSQRWRERNNFKRQIEEGVDVLTDRLAVLEEVEFRSLQVGDKNQATEAVVDAISAVQLQKTTLTTDLLLDSNRVFLELEPRCQAAWRSAYLSEEGTEYGRVLLRLASEYLVSLIRSLPDFNSEITWLNYVETRRLSQDFAGSLNTIVLPNSRSGTSRELRQAEANYRTDIVSTFGMMELFGVDLPPELRRQPLDIAYISLNVAMENMNSNGAAHQPSRAPGDTERLRFDALLSRILRVAEIWDDKSLGSEDKIREVMSAIQGLGRDSYSTASTAERILEPFQRRYVRDAPMRLIITGGAGSGKTTAVRWLAVQMASRRLGPNLAILQDHVPFIVPLRYVFRGSRTFPTEFDLVNTASSHRTSQIPGNWITDTLAGGKAVLIFDGLDELSDSSRGSALVWVDKLMKLYPRIHVIVTSRPEALDMSWFRARAFLNVGLQGMSLEDIEDCVAAWFAGLRQALPNEEWDNYARSERLVIRDIETRRPVRDLAESPLLCAMLCAFYARNVSASAPRSRGELYGSVINVLVDARERQRGISWNGPPFDLKEKLFLLQAIARHLTEQERNVIRLRDIPGGVSTYGTSALRLVEGRLSGMPTTRITATEALRYLVERSVVFQAIAVNEAQFAHKTFQEYLAARDFSLSGRLEEMLSRVNDPAWQRIIVFAASVAPSDIASRLITAILDLQVIDPAQDRSRLFLMAECVSAAGPIDPEVARRVSSAVTAILPPRSNDEADVVAGIGEGILPWLAPGGYSERELSRYCIRAAGLIGGERALQVIIQHSKSWDAGSLDQEFLGEWDRFDPREYAVSVLSNLRLSSPVTVSNGQLLELVGMLPQIRKLYVRARDGLVDLRAWGSLSNLEELDLGNVQSLRSVSGISSLGSLKKLSLTDIVSIANIDEVAELRELEELYLSGCSALSDISFLRAAARLRVLYLTRCAKVRDFSFLGALRELRTLDMSGCRTVDLTFCSNLTMLRTLRARVVRGFSGELDLSGARDLRTLAVTCDHNHTLRLPNQGRLRTVELLGPVTNEDLTAVAASQSVTELAIDDAHQLDNLDALGGLSGLRKLTIGRASRLDNFDVLADLRQLHELRISGSLIENLISISGLDVLHFLNLDASRRLKDISALAGMSSLQYVSLLGGVPGVDEVELRRASERAGFDYAYDERLPTRSTI